MRERGQASSTEETVLWLYSQDGDNGIGGMVNNAKGCVALALIGAIFCILTSTIEQNKTRNGKSFCNISAPLYRCVRR
jgi:hypothetical protein